MQNMNTRRRFLVFAFVVSLSVCALIYLNPGAVSTIATYAFIQKANTKTILFWNGFFGSESFGFDEGYLTKHCPRYNNCWATHRRYLQSIDSYDAIVFHGINKEFDYQDLPDKRRDEQRYAFMAVESPANRYIIQQFDGFFNITMTYHFDSDVIWTYADVIDEEQVPVVPSRTEYKWKTTDSGYEDKDFVEEQEEQELFRMIADKRKLAAWYVSHCETRSRRENYVSELERYAPIDRYGKCSGDTSCPKKADCFKLQVEPNYFFYLSFENSFCEDYVTEKLFNALKYNVVPVVYGGANYSRFAPPNSYINALDFDTPKDLAKYLVYLSHNVVEYKKYFEWKKQYRVVDSRPRVICDLCELLNSGGQKRSYEISKWYGMERCPLQHQLEKQIKSGGTTYATRKTLQLQ